MASTKWIQVLSKLEAKDKAERDTKQIFDDHQKRAKLEKLANETSKGNPNGTNPRKNDQKRTSTVVVRF